MTTLTIAVLLVLAALLFRTSPRWPWQPSSESKTLLLSGNIEAHESVLGFKNVQSRIVDLPFDEGQWVDKGMVLAAVDAADYQQQLAIAEANLRVLHQQLEAARQNLTTAGRTVQADQADWRQRRLDLQRTLELQRKGFVSKAAQDQAETALAQAEAVLQRDQSQQTAASRNIAVAQASVRNGEASVTLARIVLGYTTLNAPFSGVVTVRQAELGEVVLPGTPVLTLADLDHVWVRAYLNETDLGRVHLSQAVAVTSDSHPGKRYRGRISFIADKAEFTPKSVETHAERVTLVYRIKIDIANPEHQLVPGMPVDVHVPLNAAASR